MTTESGYERRFDRQIFDTLNGSTDMEQGIQAAISMIGEHYKVSRVYIFENCEDDRYVDNTFEWCAPGVEPQIQVLQHLSYEEHGYDQLFQGTPYFYCPDISVLEPPLYDLIAMQGIRAMLQVAMFDRGKMRGFVGFDDCSGPRPDWAEGGSCADVLVYLSSLLSVYLLKERNLQSATRYQKQLELSLAEAEKANRAKSAFLSNMSHEIRTPMNAILGMTHLAADEVGDRPQAAAYLEQIQSSGQYLLGVINDILEMSRIDSGKACLRCGWHTPAEVMTPVIHMIEPLMDSSGIHFHYDPKVLTVQSFQYYLDIQRVQQMLMNLLNNACKFTPAGGQVWLSFRNLRHDPDSCTATDEILIQDTGCGMSEAFLQRAFQPFEQERLDDSNVPGTGLGLALSRGIARQMGGDITVESSLGTGSTFYITHPYRYRPTPPQAIVPAAQQQRTLAHLAGRRVLLAEDNALNAVIAMRLLEKQGLTVDHADDGRRALELFEKSAPGYYAAIVMDVRMPHMDGLAATRAIRAMPRPDAQAIPILAMTANAFVEDRRLSLAAGMTDHLSKPIDPSVLYAALAKYIVP